MLRQILRLNALSCLIFGTLFFFSSHTVSAFLGTLSFQFFLPILGIILLGFGAHLVFASFRGSLIKGEIYYFSLGDFLWVVLSVFFLSSTSLVTSGKGYAASLLVALMVGFFGLMQFLMAKKMPLDRIFVKQVLKVRKEDLWRKLSDFGNVGQHHPMVKSSQLLNSAHPTGLGAKRQCTFQDGSQVKEEVIDWVEGEVLEVQVLGMSLPVQYLANRISIHEGFLTLTSAFQGKGFFSEIFVGFLMRPLLKRKLKEVVLGFNI